MNLLNEVQAAEKLGLSVHWMRRARWAGNGPEYIKIQGAVRYRPESIDRFIDSRARRSTSDAGQVRQ